MGKPVVNGIIAEYNPFHNGHAFQLNDAKAQTGAKYTIAVMSGNYMQRGTPAIIHKFKRTEMALRSGVDLVLEIPALYSTGSAEFFATGAVALLDKLGVVSHLCFGSECGDLSVLNRLADVLCSETPEYTECLNQGLRQGYSFPAARSEAIARLHPDLVNCQDILGQSNNILAIEYLKALKKRNSNISPITTTRCVSNYNDRYLGSYQSSSLAIRQAIYDNCDMNCLAPQMPDSAFPILKESLEKESPIRLDDFSRILHYKLIIDSEKKYTEYMDVNKELSDRIYNSLDQFDSFRGFCDLLKTKNITYTRVSRCLMHILLDIRKTDVEHAASMDYAPYARVLGFRREAEPLLSEIKTYSSIPLITKLADAEKLLNADAFSMLQKELRMNSVYESTAALKVGSDITNEYRSPLVIV